MSAYRLTFRPAGEAPDRRWSLHELRDLIARVKANPDATEWWRIHSHQRARVGDRLYVFRQGTASPRGIIGVGDVVAAPDFRATPTDPEPRWRAELRLQRLVDPTLEFLLPLTAIEDVVPKSLITAAASRCGRLAIPHTGPVGSTWRSGLGLLRLLADCSAILVTPPLRGIGAGAVHRLSAEGAVLGGNNKIVLACVHQRVFNRL